MTLKQLGTVCLIVGASLCALVSVALAGPRTDNRHPVGWERMHRPVRAQRAQLDPYGSVQIPKDIQKQGVFFRSEVSLRLFAKCVQHINHFARAFQVQHGLPGLGIGISAKQHGRILP